MTAIMILVYIFLWPEIALCWEWIKAVIAVIVTEFRRSKIDFEVFFCFILFLLFRANKTFRAVVCFKLFLILCICWKMYVVLRILVYKVSDLCRLFPMFHGLVQSLLHAKNLCHHHFLDLLLLFYFEVIKENLCIMHHNSWLSYCILNAFPKNNQKWSRYPS